MTAPVPRSQWEDAVTHCPDITRTTLLVGLVLSRSCTWDTGRKVHVAATVVAAKCGLKKAANVRDHVAVLVDLGWLSYQDKAPKAGSQYPVSMYWLTVPKCHSHDQDSLDVAGVRDD